MLPKLRRIPTQNNFSVMSHYEIGPCSIASNMLLYYYYRFVNNYLIPLIYR